MRQFSISRDSLVREFLEQLNIDFEVEFTKVFQGKFPDYSQSQIEEFLAEHWDEITEPIEEYRGTLYDAIDYLSTEDEEVDESSGTWGYALISIEDEEKTKKEILETLEWEIEAVIDQVMDQLNEYAQPECPYCGDSEGSCPHVLIHYDASFMDLLSGYLLEDETEVDALKSNLFNLIASGVKPNLKSSLLKDIWDYAIEGFDPDSGERDLDRTAYFNLLGELIGDFDGEAFYYSDQNSSTGYASSYAIYFAKNPKEAVSKINSEILAMIC